MNNNFTWTDELVREFINEGRRTMKFSDADVLGMDIEKFKHSKQPLRGHTLKEFLANQAEVVQLSDRTWRFMLNSSLYPGVMCFGELQRAPESDIFTVRPFNRECDIGAGKGDPTTFRFIREDQTFGIRLTALEPNRTAREISLEMAIRFLGPGYTTNKTELLRLADDFEKWLNRPVTKE